MTSWPRFYQCSVSEKLLYTCYLVTMGFAYLMALSYLYMTHAGVAGKQGGVMGMTIEDIAVSYYGNRSGTRLESAIRGPMKDYLTDNERYEIVAWLKSGAAQSGYESTVKPILTKNCVVCHNPEANPSLPNLTNWEGVQKVAAVDMGMSAQTLVKLSHIHLFGIGLFLFSIGYIFRLAEMAPWLKRVIIVIPYASMLVDIASWYLTHWDPLYAWTVVISGGLLGMSLAAQILTSLWQIWFLKAPAVEPLVD